ncbi:MAG TPA: hypothetical protein VL422_06730, partial [Miltoncostaea sp.]|nr:hypothetical protein [Miltoncostaea sp.]
MEMLTGPAGVADAGDPARIRRLELLLETIEVLEGDEDLAARVARTLELLVESGLCRAAGTVQPGRPDDPHRGDDPEPRATGRVLAIPLVSDGRAEWTLWLADPSPAAGDRALVRDVAARL